jgi:predicted RNA-binding protein Jag
MNVHEFEGKNEEEAISKAIEALGLDREDIDVEIVEAKKSAFLFGGGKVRIRVHLDEDRQGGGPWSQEIPQNAGGQAEVEQEEDKQPLDYRHPDAWDSPGARRQRSQRPRGGRAAGQRNRRGGPSSGSRRSQGAAGPDVYARGAQSPGNRSGFGRYPAEERGPERNGFPEPKTNHFVALEPESDFEREIIGFLQGLFEHAGIAAQIRIAFREDRKLGLDVDSPDSGILIGKRGQTLEAIQTVANVVASRIKNGSQRVIVDSQNYRLRRERSLVHMAEQVADEVRRTRHSRLLEAMNPFERRLIHTALSNEPDIETASEGEGLYKRVRVRSRGAGGL